jgi:hypothetical protein
MRHSFSNVQYDNLLPGLFFILIISALSVIQTIEKMQTFNHDQSPQNKKINFFQLFNNNNNTNLTFHLSSNSKRIIDHIVSKARNNNTQQIVQ